MFTVAVVSDVYHAGYKEDCVPFTAERYYLLAENERGLRMRHFYAWNGAVVHTSYEGFQYFEDVRPQARAKAQHLCNRANAWLRIGKALDPDMWEAVDPAYGSAAYIAQGTELDRCMAEQAQG